MKELFRSPIKEIWQDDKDSTGLSKLMTDRAQRFRDLTLEGKTWEEARAITDEEFDPLLEKILYPKGRKEKKKIKMYLCDDGTFASDWSPYLKIIGKGDHNLTLGGGRNTRMRDFLFRRSSTSVTLWTRMSYMPISSRTTRFIRGVSR